MLTGRLLQVLPVVLAIAAVIIRYRGFRVIRTANIAFAVVVGWNIIMLIRLAIQSKPT